MVAKVECIQEQAYWCRALHEFIHVAKMLLVSVLFSSQFYEILSLFLALSLWLSHAAYTQLKQDPLKHTRWQIGCPAARPTWDCRHGLSMSGSHFGPPAAHCRQCRRRCCLRSHSLHSGAKFMAHAQCEETEQIAVARTRVPRKYILMSRYQKICVLFSLL